MFWVESDLEDYLQLHLPVHLSHLGLDLLIIGRQTETTTRGLIDLLAIDSTGVVYIIELKLRRAKPEITAQLLAYRRSIKRITKDQLILLAARYPLHIDLLDAFQRRFGHPLPETVNESQVLIVIADSMHRQTAQSLLELKDEGWMVEAFQYRVDAHELSLVPFNLEEQDFKSYPTTGPRGCRPRSTPRSQERLSRYKVRIDVVWFWSTHAPRFISPLVTFGSIYELYVPWVRAQAAGALKPLQGGQFGRQLAELVAASSGWTGVFLPPETRIDPYEPLADLPSMSADFAGSHRIRAYLRTPIDQA